PHVLVRQGARLALRDLDPVAEHAVVAHPEGPDSGALALPPLEPRDPGARLAHLPPELAERGIPRLADQPALVERERRLVDERGLERLPEIAEVLHRLRALADERVWAALGVLADRGQERERHADGGEIPRRGHAEGDAARQAGQVSDALERLPEFGQEGRRFHQGADRIEPLPDLARPEERAEQPLAEEPPAHGRARAVHRPEERRRAAPVLQALHQLEIAGGALVEGQVVLDGEDLDAREMPERRLLRLLEVAQDRARRADRAAPARQAEPLDGGHTEVGAVGPPPRGARSSRHPAASRARRPRGGASTADPPPA